MANPTCTRCKESGVTCKDNRYQEIPPVSEWKVANRAVKIAVGLTTSTINTSRPIAECPAVNDPTLIEPTAQEWIDKAYEIALLYENPPQNS